MQRLKARFNIEDLRSPVGRGLCRSCGRSVIEHIGDACLFDFTTLNAAPIDRVLGALFHVKNQPEAQLTLAIPGVAAINYIVHAQSYNISLRSEPDYYVLGKLTPEWGRPSAEIELELVGVGG